jgi:cytosine/adenosine deaminase-related metal-dependent hydrolase
MRYRAAWVVPTSGPPVAGGTVTIDGSLTTGGTGGRLQDLGLVAILPGLVNAHTHLELSWMRERIPPSSSMPRWAASLIADRRTQSLNPPEPIVDAIREARASGTSLVGDVANTLASFAPLARSALRAVIFRELLGFSAIDPERLVASALGEIAALPTSSAVRATVVPHAPYSVSPALMQAIARRCGGQPFSIHLGESAEEVQFLRDGSGAWRTLLESLGAWNPAWTPPGCRPVEYLDRLGLVTSDLVAVHGVQLSDGELARLAAAGATLVTCPRSNRWTGAGDPPVERFYRSGVRVAVGTDSLASVRDLNLFAELAEIRRLAPAVPAREILRSATVHGAQALGFGSELGTLDPGARADLIAVRVPAWVTDVEEYLVGGIDAADVAWLTNL